jgi:hypothetical protein
MRCWQWDGTESGCRFDVLVGYRFLELSDRVHMYERLVSTYVPGHLMTPSSRRSSADRLVLRDGIG